VPFNGYQGREMRWLHAAEGSGSQHGA